MRARGPAGWCAIALTMTGCMVGPRYNRPAAAAPAAYREPGAQPEAGAGQWKVAEPSDQAGRERWWEAFGDKQLDALEQEVPLHNETLKAAEARFRQARALVQFNRASLYPTIATGPQISTVRNSAHRPFAISSGSSGDFVLPFDVSYEVDFWGRVRRTVTASAEEAQATAADLQTATLSLQAELAFDYFELRAADAQQKLLDDTVKSYEDAVRLTQNRFEGGASPKSDVAQAQTQLDTARAQDTDVAVQRAQYEHAIAVLAGRAPEGLQVAADALDGEPPMVPAGVPSLLLERRPDIAAAERRVAEANEQIGIAKAAFYPTVTLGALVGLEGSSLLNWFEWPSRFWAVGPGMLEVLFDAGRRRAGSDAAVAAYDETVANYRQSVLGAFQEVEDNLAALRILQREAGQQREAVEAARESLRLFTNRYRGGVDNYLQVITAQTVALSNERNDVDIRRRRFDASVLLIKALGGGWSATSLPAARDLGHR